MMECDQARRRFLEADLAELTAEADTDLGRHLATCARCRSEAERIRTAEGALGDWLRARTPRGDLAGALARARTAARRRSRVRRFGGAAAMLAAAALAGVLLVPTRPPPVPAPHVAEAPSRNGTFFVTAPPGREMVVVHTADPKIVVVWYLPIRRT
jgi:hypothetical protein